MTGGCCGSIRFSTGFPPVSQASSIFSSWRSASLSASRLVSQSYTRSVTSTTLLQTPLAIPQSIMAVGMLAVLAILAARLIHRLATLTGTRPDRGEAGPAA